VAVGIESADQVEFHYESTGRYGGLTHPMSSTLMVPCKSVNQLLDEILQNSKSPEIDVLKIDVEGLETGIISSIRPDLLKKIRIILAEVEGNAPQLSGFQLLRHGPIYQWKNTLLPPL
jgi:FkbM family methyltransferase